MNQKIQGQKLHDIITIVSSQPFAPPTVKTMIKALEQQMTTEEKETYKSQLIDIFSKPDDKPPAPNLIVLKPVDKAFNFVSHNLNRLAVKTEYPPQGGMFVYYKDHQFPEQAFPFPHAFYCLDAVKRAIMNILRSVKRSWLLKVALLWAISPFGRKTLDNFIDLFADFSGSTLHKISIKSEFYCTSAREIERAAQETVKGMVDTPEQKQIADKIIMTICLIWEFDNAYRYRAQDLMSSFDRALFIHNPIRAIWKLFDTAIAREQEDSGLKDRFAMAKVAAVVLMMNRRFRKTLKTFINNLDFDKLALDEADQYWSYFFCLYNFDGKDFDQRTKERVERGWRVNV